MGPENHVKVYCFGCIEQFIVFGTKISILLTKENFALLCTFDCELTLKLRTRPNDMHYRQITLIIIYGFAYTQTYFHHCSRVFEGWKRQNTLDWLSIGELAGWCSGQGRAVSREHGEVHRAATLGQTAKPHSVGMWLGIPVPLDIERKHSLFLNIKIQNF